MRKIILMTSIALHFFMSPTARAWWGSSPRAAVAADADLEVAINGRLEIEKRRSRQRAASENRPLTPDEKASAPLVQSLGPIQSSPSSGYARGHVRATLSNHAVIEIGFKIDGPLYVIENADPVRDKDDTESSPRPRPRNVTPVTAVN